MGVDPETKLDQASAPDPVGACYNRPPKDRPAPAPVTRLLRYAEVLAVTTGTGVDYVTAQRCLSDGTGASGRTLYLKGSPDANTSLEGQTAVVFDNVSAGDIIAYIPADGEEEFGGQPCDGQIIPFAGADGAYLYSKPAIASESHFWAEVTGVAGAPTYDIEEIGGTRTGTALEVNGNIGVDVGTFVRAFLPKDGTATDFAFEFGGGGGGLLENDFDAPEVWPALVIDSANPLLARIWCPGGGVVPAVDDTWHLSEDDETVEVEYDQIGDGTFDGDTLIPRLRDYAAAGESTPEVADWTFARCIPAAFTVETIAPTVPPDGELVAFDLELGVVPLPFTLTVFYEIAAGVYKRLYMTRTVTPAEDLKVDLEGAGSGHCHVRTKLVSILCDTPPMTGGLIKCRYVPFADCDWMATTIFQTVEGVVGLPAINHTIKKGWIGVDADGRVAHGTPVGERLKFIVLAHTVGDITHFHFADDGTDPSGHEPIYNIELDFDETGHLQLVTGGS